jgi:hypothetical protein
MTIKNRLIKIEAALAESTVQYIVKIDDRQGATVKGWRHASSNWSRPEIDFYDVDADLSHLRGLNIFFAIYAD